MKVTTWSPDTCDCKLQYEWDETLPDNIRVHIFKQALFTCPFHSVFLIPLESYNSALDHNQRKNKTEGWILQNLTSQTGTTNPDGSIVWKEGVTFNWSFSGTGEIGRASCRERV